MILSKGHSREVDLWSFGVLCYEMLTGEVPFKGETPYALYANILKGAFVMPDYLSSSAKDLISGMFFNFSSTRVYFGFEVITCFVLLCI